MASNALGGTAYLKVDGQQYKLRGNLKCTGFTPTRTGKAGVDGMHGYIETPAVPVIEYQFSDMGGLSIVQLGNITSSTITATLINGKSYVLSQGWHEGDAPALDPIDGSVSGKFAGMSGQEILGS